MKPAAGRTSRAASCVPAGPIPPASRARATPATRPPSSTSRASPAGRPSARCSYPDQKPWSSRVLANQPRAAAAASASTVSSGPPSAPSQIQGSSRASPAATASPVAGTAAGRTPARPGAGRRRASVRALPPARRPGPVRPGTPRAAPSGMTRSRPNTPSASPPTSQTRPAARTVADRGSTASNTGRYADQHRVDDAGDRPHPRRLGQPTDQQHLFDQPADGLGADRHRDRPAADQHRGDHRPRTAARPSRRRTRWPGRCTGGHGARGQADPVARRPARWPRRRRWGRSGGRCRSGGGGGSSAGCGGPTCMSETVRRTGREPGDRPSARPVHRRRLTWTGA